MSVTALRDAIKLQLDTQLGAVPPPFEADRIKIAQAFADAIDPHFAHEGGQSSPASSSTMRVVQKLAEENERLKKENTDFRKQVGDITTLVHSLVNRLAAMEARV